MSVDLRNCGQVHGMRLVRVRVRIFGPEFDTSAAHYCAARHFETEGDWREPEAIEDFGD